MKKSILFLLFIPTVMFGQNSVKLLIDNGRYSESPWCRQIALTSDDKTLIVNDFVNGLRFYDTKTGNLINQFSAHSLEGDIYFNNATNILVTTGDKKIKIWGVNKGDLIKDIKQSFHSQFMNDVFIDKKSKYVFAENTKYDIATSMVIKNY
jgi:WD40 repeat protein